MKPNQIAAQTKEWIDRCIKTHDKCNEVLVKSTFVPSRLIEIAGFDEAGPAVRLQVKQLLPPAAEYLTLSHCWGSKMPFRLLKHNFTACTENIPLDKLSLVFQNAIDFTRRMGFRYLWIDSLCAGLS